MDMELEVSNPNLFPLKLSDGKFTFSVESALQMNGVLEKIIHIPAKGSQMVSIHAQLTDGNMLKTGLKMLTDKKNTRFACKFTDDISSENKVLSDSKIASNMTGTLQEIVNTVKKAD